MAQASNRANAAVLTGARSIAAIAEWATDAPQPVRAALGARRDAPGHFAVPAEATIRRTLGRLDADALASAIGAWLADRDPDPAGAGRRRAVAVDGNTLRGAPVAGGDSCPGAPAGGDEPRKPAVPAPRQVGGAPAYQLLLEPLDLAGVVVTADALQPHPTPHSSRSLPSLATTCWWSRPTSRPCWTAANACPGTACLSWTAPAIAVTVASSCAPSRPSASTTSGSPMPPRSSGHPQDPRPRRPHPAV